MGFKMMTEKEKLGETIKPLLDDIETLTNKLIEIANEQVGEKKGMEVKLPVKEQYLDKKAQERNARNLLKDRMKTLEIIEKAEEIKGRYG